MPFAYRVLLLIPLLLLLDAPDAAAKTKSGKAKPVAAAPVSAECTDFYESANADWLKAHPAPAIGSISAFDAMLASARTQEQALLQDFARDPHDDAQRTLALLWADGMNEPAAETAGAAPLQALFDRIAKAKKPKDIPGVIADLHAAGMPVLFNFSADVDLKDFDRQLGYANQGGLGLPDPDYYTRTDAETRTLLGRYRAYIESILRLSGTPPEKVSTESGWVLAIEMQLAQASLPLVQLRDPNSAYRPIALRDLTKAYPNLAFDKFLRAQHADDDHISLAQDGFFRVADGLLANVPVEQWQAYLRFHVASALAPYLSRGFQSAHYELYDHVLNGDAGPRPREQLVLDAIDRALGDAMGHAWAERYLSPDAKDAATHIADGLRGAMKRAIERDAWMDDATRAAALAKLDRLRIEIGEPSRTTSLSGLVLGNGYAADMLAAAAWQHQRDMAAIGKRTNERRWPVLAQIPDVSYDLVQNRIVVTAAFLQAPVFDAAAPIERQYGAFGALIGHQLHYAFDGKGRSIDADGQFRDWWTPLASAGYEQRTAPIIVQYDAYPVLGMVKVNGHLTRDENLADLAGVELAYEAFKAASPQKQVEVAAPSLQPTKPASQTKLASKHAQQTTAPAPPSIDRGFFDAYAKVWASSIAPDVAAAEVVSAIQAPAKYRVDGPLANLPEFAKVYACKPGQPMISATPVSIWR